MLEAVLGTGVHINLGPKTFPKVTTLARSRLGRERKRFAGSRRSLDGDYASQDAP